MHSYLFPPFTRVNRTFDATPHVQKLVNTGYRDYYPMTQWGIHRKRTILSDQISILPRRAIYRFLFGFFHKWVVPPFMNGLVGGKYHLEMENEQGYPYDFGNLHVDYSWWFIWMNRWLFSIFYHIVGYEVWDSPVIFITFIFPHCWGAKSWIPGRTSDGVSQHSPDLPPWGKEVRNQNPEIRYMQPTEWWIHVCISCVYIYIYLCIYIKYMCYSIV